MKRIATILSVSLLLMLAGLAVGSLMLMHPWVQLRLTRVLFATFSERTATEIQIGDVRVALNGEVALADLHVREVDGRTLLAVDNVRAVIDFRALFDRSVEIRTIELSGADVRLRQDAEGKLNIATFGASLAGERGEVMERHEPSWKMHVRHVRFHDSEFAFDPGYSEGVDDDGERQVRSLRFAGIDLEARDLDIAAGSVALDLRRLQIADALGIPVIDGELLFAVTPYEMRFEHLTLHTGNSTVRASVSLVSPSADGVADVDDAELDLPATDSAGGGSSDPEYPPRITGESRLAATVFDTRIAASEFKQLADQFFRGLPFPEGDIELSGAAFGALDDLQIPVMELTVGEVNRLEARGNVRGLLTTDRFAYEAVIDRLEFGREQVERLRAGRDELPFNVPGSARLAGTVEGDRRRTVLNLSGDSETVRASLELDVDLRDERPRFSGAVDIAYADLGALGLVGEPLQLRGQSVFDVTFVTPADFSGDLRIQDFELLESERTHTLDQLNLSASSAATQSQLALDSELATVDFRADLPFGSIAEDVLLHLRRYVAPSADARQTDNSRNDGGAGSARDQRGAESDVARGSLELSFAVHQPLSLLVPLIPQLHELAPLSGKVSYDGRSADLSIVTSVDRVVLEDYSVTGLELRVSSAPALLLYEIRAGAVSISDTEFLRPVVQGDARSNTVSAYLSFDDSDGDEQLRLGVRAAIEQDQLAVVFDPAAVHVRSQRWDVADDHAILLGRDGVAIRNLRFQRDQALISVSTGSERRELPPSLDIQINDLQLGTVVPVFNLDANQYGGTVSADLRVSFNDQPLPLVTGSFEGRDLVLAEREVGDVLLSVAPLNDAEYQIDGKLRYMASSASVDGVYRISDHEIDLVVTLERLDVDYLAGYIPDEVSDARGYAAGEIVATGPVNDPQIRGEIALRDARFTVRQLGTGFEIGDDVIRLSGNVVEFDQFTVRDAQGNRLSIDGTVALSAEPEDIVPTLTLLADRFMLLDTTRQQNNRFFGRLVIGSDLQIGGTLAEPEALGALELQQGSSVTFVLPDPGTGVAEAEGVVRFTDRLAVEEEETEPSVASTLFRGLDVTANLQVDRNTMVDLVVDERTGDRLRMRGGGDFSLGIDPAGTLSLAGEYVISDGSYVLSFYNITRREFSIASGSSVVWTGDPLDADLNVRAVYTIRTSVAPLLSPGSAPEERTAIMGELPFQVVLSMQGSLTGPEIEFVLDMPPGDRGAMGGAPYAAISQINEQESRRNTQAFSLIVLNQFIADDLSGIDEAAVVAAGARSSASRLLTYQLNALSRRAIPGVDLTFEVESYEEYTEAGPEGRTEIGLQVSQRLLDDRLIVRFGGQIDVEGERSRQAGLSEIAGDLSVEYLLTPDGRYRIRGFREQEYQGPLDGSLTTTGLAFVFSHEFDRLPRLRPRPAPEALRKRDEDSREAE